MTVRLAELEDLIASRQRDIGNYTARMEQLAAENVALRARIEQLQTERLEAEAAGGPTSPGTCAKQSRPLKRSN